MNLGAESCHIPALDNSMDEEYNALEQTVCMFLLLFATAVIDVCSLNE